jgi:hypothetical protein
MLSFVRAVTYILLFLELVLELRKIGLCSYFKVALLWFWRNIPCLDLAEFKSKPLQS